MPGGDLENELMGMLQRTCKPAYLDLSGTRVDFKLTMNAPSENCAPFDLVLYQCQQYYHDVGKILFSRAKAFAFLM